MTEKVRAGLIGGKAMLVRLVCFESELRPPRRDVGVSVVARMYREYTCLCFGSIKGIELCNDVVVSMYVSQKETMSNQFTDFDSTKRDKYSVEMFGAF